MIKRFKEVSGLYIEKGSVIKFYDFENGNVYTPFVKKRDVIYSKPVSSIVIKPSALRMCMTRLTDGLEYPSSSPISTARTFADFLESTWIDNKY